MNPKPPWLSKTLWINVLAIIGSVVVYMAGVDPSTWSEISVSALALINICLRLTTNQPIDWGGNGS
jgi:hypothetical protein